MDRPDFIPDGATAVADRPDFIPAERPDFVPDRPDFIPATMSERAEASKNTPTPNEYLERKASESGSSNPLKSFGKAALVAGSQIYSELSKDPLKQVAHAEGLGPPAEKTFTPQNVSDFRHNLNIAVPTKDTIPNKIGEFAGGAVPAAGAGLIAGPAGAALAMGAQSAETAREESQQERDAGRPVTQSQEDRRATGYGLVGAAAGELGGRIPGLSQGIKSVAGRLAVDVAGNALVGAGQKASENIISDRPVSEGVGGAAATMGAFGGIMGAGHELAAPRIYSGKIPEGSTVVGEGKLAGQDVHLLHTPDGRLLHIPKERPDFIPDNSSNAPASDQPTASDTARVGKTQEAGAGEGNLPTIPVELPVQAPASPHGKDLGLLREISSAPPAVLESGATDSSVQRASADRGEPVQPTQLKEDFSGPSTPPDESARGQASGEGLSDQARPLEQKTHDTSSEIQPPSPSSSQIPGRPDPAAEAALASSGGSVESDRASSPDSTISPPAGQNQSSAAKQEFIDTRGSGKRFHGTSAPIDQLQDYTYGPMNIYGQGLYTTDDFTTAHGYSKKGRGTEPSIYRIEETRPTKMLDLESPPSPEVAKIFSDMGKRSYDSLGQFGKAIYDDLPAGTPIRKWFDEVRAESKTEGFSADDVQELFEGVNRNLTDLGYDGYRHTGGMGAGKGKRLHEVKVYFDPTQTTRIKSANPADYALPSQSPPAVQSGIGKETGAETVSVRRVIPEQRNHAQIMFEGKPEENESGGFKVKRIKLHDDDTGSYDVIDVPPEVSHQFENSADAREAIFQHLEQKYPMPKELPAPPESVKPENTGEMFGAGPARINDPAFTKPVEGPTSVKNSIVDQQRASRGLPAAMEEQRRSDPKVWDAAMKEIDANPRVQDELIQSLKDKPRPVSDREVALLRHRQLDLENQHDAARQAVVDAYEKGDDAARVQNQVRESAISDELLDVYNVGKTSGRESARGLRARSVLVNQDFALASMETAKRATNGGKPLTDPQKIELKTQFDKIKTAQDSLKRYTDTKTQETKLIKSIADLDARIRAGNLSPRNKVLSTADTKTVADLRQQRTDLNRQLDILRRTAGIKGRIETGDFSQSPRREVRLDPKSQELQAQLERYKQAFQDGLIRDRLKMRTTQEKVQDTFIKWRRAFLLSSPITLAKLTSAAAERMAFTPIEEAVGAGIGKMIPGVSSRAPREGGLSVRAEAAAIKDGFTKGMADAWKTLRTGKSDLDALYGKHNAIPPEAIDVFGNIHGALKTTAKRAEFARSFQKLTEAAIRGGMDATDPSVQTRIVVESYKEAQKSIFMQDNRVVSMIKAGISQLEAKDKVTGEVPLRGKIGATAIRTLLPIVKVPTNIVAETMQYATGLASGGARLARAYGKGIENIKPAEADLIMRSLKKGSVGAAVLALGYFGADQIGGYYQPNQKSDVKFGSIKVFGHQIPTFLIHNPLLECLQIGATIRRVADSYFRKKDTDTQGIGSGVAAAALGVIQETPFIRESAELSDLQDPYQRTATAGRFLKGLAVPQAVSFVAEQTDKDSSGVVKRKPTTLGENLKMGIPGLRKQVPAAKSR